MRRLVLAIVIVLSHAFALLCTAGTRLSPESSARRAELAFKSSRITPHHQSAPPNDAPAPTPSTPPARTEQGSTYEQYLYERELAAAAQATEEPADSLHLQFNLDFTNAYFYRGILQQDEGLIVQPGARLTINLHRDDDLSIDAFLGTWNSFGSNGGANSNDLVSDWYESDLIAGFVIAKGPLSLTTAYTFLTSPSDAFATVQEIDFTLGYDDSEHLGKFALKPYALLAFETSSIGSDGADPGVYLELGVGPGFSFNLGKSPISVTFPVAVGLSLHDYYQDSEGADDTLGFVQAGTRLSMPLPFGDRYGAWTLNAGASVMYLGDNLARINSDDDLEFIGTIGLQWNF